MAEETSGDKVEDNLSRGRSKRQMKRRAKKVKKETEKERKTLFEGTVKGLEQRWYREKEGNQQPSGQKKRKNKCKIKKQEEGEEKEPLNHILVDVEENACVGEKVKQENKGNSFWEKYREHQEELSSQYPHQDEEDTKEWFRYLDES